MVERCLRRSSDRRGERLCLFVLLSSPFPEILPILQVLSGVDSFILVA
jgi:hypothetical protein